MTLARQRLATAGYRPTLAAIDGAGGLPEHAPYNRIIATCAVPAIPRAWAEQLAPGGSILVDLKLAISAGNLVHLHRCSDGTLQGRFTARRASFMTMRHHNDQPAALGEPMPSDPARLTHRPGLGTRRRWRGFSRSSAVFPGTWCTGWNSTPKPTNPPQRPWRHRTVHGPASASTTAEAGETPVWTSVERAYQLWVDLGEPSWDRLGLTITPDGLHSVWLDEPSGDHRWIFHTVP
ncbi:MAG: hypothetical protein ACRDTE_10080 [Pseudonocardiaceae bacterium]